MTLAQLRPLLASLDENPGRHHQRPEFGVVGMPAPRPRVVGHGQDLAGQPLPHPLGVVVDDGLADGNQVLAGCHLAHHTARKIALQLMPANFRGLAVQPGFQVWLQRGVSDVCHAQRSTRSSAARPAGQGKDQGSANSRKRARQAALVK